MKIIPLDGQPNEALARALDQFERQFSYPLGQKERFYVLHGNDYTKFFRAMGRARCFIAEMEGEVIGSLAVAIRRIGLPDGTDQEVCYLGDLKIASHARGGSTLFRLACAAAAWVPQSVCAHFGVVMDGTHATPDEYSGRAGLPEFTETGKIVIFRLLTSGAPDQHYAGISESDLSTVTFCFRELSAGRYCTPCVEPLEQSLVTPAWLMTINGAACGCLQDTRRAKRLMLQDGTELVSMHLSSFAYRDIRSGSVLIQEALRRAHESGAPALFVAIAAEDSDLMLTELGKYQPTLAPATIYSHGLARDIGWNLNTTEI